MSHPAWAAMARPADSLPVTVTAATRSSASTISTWPASISSVWKPPRGKPARRKSASMASAHWGTLEACLSRPTLPAIRAGARKRKTCQKGKFQGMTARMTPSGSQRTTASSGAVRRPAPAQDAGGVLGVEAAGGGALGDFGAGLGDGLAHLGGDERGEVGGLALQKAGELVHAERAVGEREFRGAGERGLGESDLFQQGLIGERGEAAQQNSGCGIDGLDGHGLAQRQAYQERRV